MPLSRTARAAIPVVVIGGLLLANRLTDRFLEGRSGEASLTEGLPPQGMSLGAFSFETPIPLESRDVSEAQRAQWVPPFETVSKYFGYDRGLAVTVLRATGLADTTVDLQRAAQGMLDGMRGPKGERMNGRAEPATLAGRPAMRLTGDYNPGTGASVAAGGLTMRAGTEYIAVLVLGPSDRVRTTTELLERTLRVR